jgi:hypothetical protein
MYFDGEYRKIGSVNSDLLAEAVQQISEETWYASTLRQQAFQVHLSTQTVHLIFDDDMRHSEPTIHPQYQAFEPLLKPVMREIEAYYSQAGIARTGPTATVAPYFVRIILVRLLPDTSIGAHYDNGYSLCRAHRIHFPIVTNEKTVFTIDEHSRHIPAGEIWEINNRKRHAVRNDGAARIHAIFDYVIPGEIIQARDGQVIA